jgi:glucokinase
MEMTLRGELIDILADLPVRPAELGESAAIIGAARGAWNLIAGQSSGEAAAWPVDAK